MAEARTADEVRTFIHGMWADVAPAWATSAVDVEERARPITERMLEAVRVGRGARVLELASGPGGAGLAAAEAVGPEGLVVISDVVEAMVDVAATRAAALGLRNVRTKVIDLEDIDEPSGSFDGVLCREGMMFALDPAHAAREMHRVLVPGGAVAAAVWAVREDNPWLGVLLDAITEITETVVPPPGMPGPFALGDEYVLRSLFVDAGFDAVVVERLDAPLRVASFDAWWTRNLTVAGPVVGILNRLDDESRTRLKDNLRHALATYQHADGSLELPGVALVVTGVRS
jgi:ubiquinone/menaquinone biosynthesis C-methylase UbiE